MTDEEDRPDGTAAQAGAAVGNALFAPFRLLGHVVNGFAIFVKTLFLAPLSKVPKIGPQMAAGLIKLGYKLRLKKGDVIVNVIYEDGVVKPRAGQYQSEKTAFETDNGEIFYAKGIGYDPKRLEGEIPVVWALRAGSEITEPLEAAIANARQLGRFQQFTQPGGDPDVAVDINPDGYDRGSGIDANAKATQPVPDGGVSAGAQAGARIGNGGQAQQGQRREPPAPETDGDDYDGQIVSYRIGHELFGTKVAQDEMQRQETRGKLAALDALGGMDNWKTYLAILAAFALGLLGPALAGRLAGSSGDAIAGGAESLPVMIGPWVHQLFAVLPGVVG